MQKDISAELANIFYLTSKVVIVLILGKLGTCTHLLRLETISNWFFVSFAKKFTIRSSIFSLHFVLRTLRTRIWTEPFLLHLTLVFRTYKTSVNTEKFDLLQISHSSWNIQNKKIGKSYAYLFKCIFKEIMRKNGEKKTSHIRILL